MKYFSMLLIDIALIGLYLFAKLAPHKDKLDAKHRGWYDIADRVFGWATRGLAKSFKPYKVGDGIYLDMGQLSLFVLLVMLTLVMMAAR